MTISWTNEVHCPAAGFLSKGRHRLGLNTRTWQGNGGGLGGEEERKEKAGEGGRAGVGWSLAGAGATGNPGGPHWSSSLDLGPQQPPEEAGSLGGAVLARCGGPDTASL